MAEPYYLTTAIHYPNGKPHIGHAYETIAADVVARFQRLRGRDVRFQTGTDEHGLKMAQKARDLGQSPRELADEMSGYFKELFDVLNISYDRFIRTTDDDHHRASQAIWRAMDEFTAIATLDLRVDYVLPSRSLKIVRSGVFWPPAGDPASALLDASDHRLVWVDIDAP